MLRNWFKKFYRGSVFLLSAKAPFIFIFFYRYIYKAKKGSLADFINKYSKSKGQIRFLQIGANDGFNHDPLHKFIRRDGWKGLMLEPQPDVFKDYLEKLHANYPDLHTWNVAMAKEKGSMTLYKIAFSKDRWATGLSSFDKSVLYEKVKNGQMEKMAKKYGNRLPENKENWISKVQIATVSSSEINEFFSQDKPDLIMIDTEGFDFEIIKLLDLEYLQPEVLIYETVNLDEQKNDCENYMTSLNYHCLSINKDSVTIRKDKPDLIDLANEILA